MRSSRRPLAVVLAAAGLVAWLVAVATLVVTPARADEVPGATGSTATDSSATPSEEPSEVASESASESPSASESESPSESPTPSEDPSEGPSTSLTADPVETLTNAVLRWGVNHESNTAAPAMGTYNFLMAGALPNPGKGGHQVLESEWRQRSGNVEIEKWDPVAGVWVDASWAGLQTDGAGRPLVSSRSSGHEMVFSGGTGVADREKGTLHLEWRGTVTLVYYSGLSFFYLTDPVLDVVDGRGTLTATLSGYGSAQDDPGKWLPLDARVATAADLPTVTLGADGFVAEPSYAGVVIDGGAVPQVQVEAGWGSFPPSWVSFMQEVGTASFWYSSGGAADGNKAPTPVSVSYDASRPVVVAPPPASEAPVIRNSAPPPPTSSPAPGAGAAPLPPLLPALAEPPIADVAGGGQPLSRPDTDLRLAAMRPQAPSARSTGRSWPWWSGGAALLLAAATLLLPPPRHVAER